MHEFSPYSTLSGEPSVRMLMPLLSLGAENPKMKTRDRYNIHPHQFGCCRVFLDIKFIAPKSVDDSCSCMYKPSGSRLYTTDFDSIYYFACHKLLFCSSFITATSNLTIVPG